MSFSNSLTSGMKKDTVNDERLKRVLEIPLCPVKKAKEHSEDLKALRNALFVEDELARCSKIFKALSDVNRLKILKLLGARPMCVCEVMVVLDVTQPTASHHLGILEEAGLIRGKREGKWIFYEVSNSWVLRIVDAVKSPVNPS